MEMYAVHDTAVIHICSKYILTQQTNASSNGKTSRSGTCSIMAEESVRPKGKEEQRVLLTN